MLASAGLDSIATFDQSASISSARMSGSEVIEPWPISAPVLRMVTVPSGAMRTQALSGLAADAFTSAANGNEKTKLRLPLTFRKSLRERFISGLPRGALDRARDAVIGAAAADVAVHVLYDLLARGLG